MKRNFEFSLFLKWIGNYFGQCINCWMTPFISISGWSGNQIWLNRMWGRRKRCAWHICSGSLWWATIMMRIYSKAHCTPFNIIPIDRIETTFLLILHAELTDWTAIPRTVHRNIKFCWIFSSLGNLFKWHCVWCAQIQMKIYAFQVDLQWNYLCKQQTFIFHSKANKLSKNPQIITFKGISSALRM